MNELIEYLAAIVAVVVVFAPHEFAHAYTAYKCGDGTAKMYGRLTLNPIKHLDPYGFLLCILAGFGWAKPVPINPRNFRNYRTGLFLTSIAGVTANYIVALLVYPFFLLVVSYFPVSDGNYYVYYLLRQIFALSYTFSLSVFVFNLLPFSPLDGFRVVESLTREISPVRRFLKNYGFYILVALVLESFVCNLISRYTDIYYVQYFNLLNYVQWFAYNILGYPIMALWNTIFGLPLPTLAPII